MPVMHEACPDRVTGLARNEQLDLCGMRISVATELVGGEAKGFP